MSTINIQNVQYLTKITIYAKKQGNIIYKHKKKQSIEIGPELTEMVESTNKVFNSYYKYIQGFRRNHE